ncbi:TetR/AcrR family transcriptional regulator [Streptomyces marincola]|uniref:TetR/AcrR family transcriptional regulator n=1 Tax=Streptomyces marincola TaxID=2878388 RepID=UPI00298FD568|nr:TetR/AcrR family transcriptional regulator [Streptomyces marincola]
MTATSASTPSPTPSAPSTSSGSSAATSPAASTAAPVGRRAADACTRLRADAVRNRERILLAAREAIVEHGPEAPLDDIARRAGVGNATLYRHFPDRHSLLFHVMLYVNERIVEQAEQTLKTVDDPFEALCRMVLASAEERVGGLCPMLGFGIDPEDPQLVASRERMHRVTQQIVDRAHESGALRADIGSGDLLVAVARLTQPVPGTQEDRRSDMTEMARRHLQVFLDGLRTPPRSPLPGRASNLADFKDGFCAPAATRSTSATRSTAANRSGTAPRSSGGHGPGGGPTPDRR